MRFQAITQIILVVVAVLMVLFVIKPKLAEIGTKQAEARDYEQAVERATQYNNKLAGLINKAESFSRDDLLALETYLPKDIDVLQVSQDIENIVGASGLLLENVESSSGNEAVTSSVDSGAGTPIGDPAGDPAMTGMSDTNNAAPFAPSVNLLDQARRDLVLRQFKFTALGTYDQFKQLLTGLEGNNYPLRIIEMSFEVSSDSDLTQYSFTIETYAMNKDAAAESNNPNSTI